MDAGTCAASIGVDTVNADAPSACASGADVVSAARVAQQDFRGEPADDSVVYSAVKEFAGGLLDGAEPFIQENLHLLLSIAVSAVLLIGLLIWISTPAKRRVILLCGPPDGGKTTLFYTLQGIKLPLGTVTSTTQNAADVTIKGVSPKPDAHVVDAPGHERLADITNSWVPKAAVVVFMLDSAQFMQQRVQASRQLYGILRLMAARRDKPRLVICCNKTDLDEQAFKQSFILRQLQKEIGVLRETRKGQLGMTEKDANDRLMNNEDVFTFTACTLSVTHCSVSIRNEDLSPLLELL